MPTKPIPAEIRTRINRTLDCLKELIPDIKRPGVFTQFEQTSLNRMAKQLKTVLTSVIGENQQLTKDAT